VLSHHERDEDVRFRSEADLANKGNLVSHALYDLLRRLEAAGVYFTLGRHRADSVLVSLTLVGERVDVDVFEDGHMEVSRFVGTEDVIGGVELVDRLIDENTD
jgi:hypothetical protein